MYKYNALCFNNAFAKYKKNCTQKSAYSFMKLRIECNDKKLSKWLKIAFFFSWNTAQVIHLCVLAVFVYSSSHRQIYVRDA